MNLSIREATARKPKSRIRRTRLRQGKPLRAGNFFRRRRSRRNIHGPNLSDA